MRVARSLESNFPVFSAKYKRIAPDSKTLIGAPLGPCGSVIAGIFEFG
jgi:hypothetical protein